VLGWAIAATPPDRSAGTRQAANELLLKARARVDPLLRSARAGWGLPPRRSPEPSLAQRVRQLEAEVAILRARLGIPIETSDVVMELLRPGEAIRTSRPRQG
jgi:hypothetical protein